MLVLALSACGPRVDPSPPPSSKEPPISAFLDVRASRLRRGWRDGYAPMLLEVARFRSGTERTRVMHLLEDLTGERFRGDHDTALRWAWALPYEPHADYGAFKSTLYGTIDPRFRTYFDDPETPRIRLDEVRWGGVKRDGIPPLDHPETLPAAEAAYLADSDVVFGVFIEGEARAYPKRILAWHELVRDEVGGQEMLGVYCTLCGAMIVYDPVVDGTHHELGTSGFLYRSNKLMVDYATESLWSTLTGEPVIGPLSDDDITLAPGSVVTTTWGQWSADHPDTRVLSLQTGHRRDYAEGAAYREYFATDELMFTVPQDDPRLANKAEVLALRFGDGPPTALSLVDLPPVRRGRLGHQEYVVLTDPSGANRVYDATALEIVAYEDGQARDADGGVWEVLEHALVRPDGSTRGRLPAHRAFWFGWRAAFPDTVLLENG